MSSQWWIVAALVLGAALYAGWRLAPAILRGRLRRALGLKRPAPDTGPCAHCSEHKH